MSEASLPHRVKKVSITNTFAANGGDAAILLAVIDQVRRQFGADVQLVIFEQQREITARYLPGLDFRCVFFFRIKNDRENKYWVRLLRVLLMLRLAAAAWALRLKSSWLAKLILSADEFKDLNEVATADAVITTGGTYLVENYFLLPMLFELEIARILQRPLIFYTQSLGPFNNPFNRRVLRKLFAYARLVLLRDSRSLKNVEALDVTGDHFVVTSDVVFGFAQESVLSKATENPPGFKNDFLKVGFTVRNWAYFKDRCLDEGMNLYEQSIIALVTTLVQKHGARVIFVSTCQGVKEHDEYEDDSKLALKIKSMLPAEIASAVEVDESYYRYDLLMEIYRSCDLVVSTRLHGAILALCSGTPVLPIAYEFKTTEMFTNFGLAEWLLDIETIEPQKAVLLLERYLEQLPVVRRTLFEQVELSRREVERSARLMRDVVLAPS